VSAALLSTRQAKPGGEPVRQQLQAREKLSSGPPSLCGSLASATIRLKIGHLPLSTSRATYGDTTATAAR
jgi:hypothetical protein